MIQEGGCKEIQVYRLLKDIVQPKKRGGGGQEGYQLIRLNFVRNLRYFVGTLKGLIVCFKFKKKRFQSLVPKIYESFLSESATKNLEAC